VRTAIPGGRSGPQQDHPRYVPQERGTLDRRSTRCDVGHVTTTISQPELRYYGGDIMRHLEAGETFIVTRAGKPVGELGPVRRGQFVSSSLVADIFHDAPAVDADRFLRWTAWQTRVSTHMPDARPLKGALDTSVIIDLERIDPLQLPLEVAVTAITMADSNCNRRFAVRSASVLTGRYSYAYSWSCLMSAASSSASDWYAVGVTPSGTNSATTVLSALTAIRSKGLGCLLSHASASVRG